MEKIKCADWVVDLGPEGGEEGGRVIAEGTPEEVAREASSHTGQFLARALARQRTRRAAPAGRVDRTAGA